MNIKGLYNRYYSFVDRKSERLDKKKTWVAELLSVRKRSGMSNSVKWSDQEQKAFDHYWEDHFGRRISNKWHKIYQSINGEYCIEYIPEMLYTTKIEHLLNDYRYARVFADKALIESIADRTGSIVPETVAVCSDSKYFDHNRRPISYEKFCQTLMNAHHDIVLKPTVDSSSGKNIQFVHVDELSDIQRIIPQMGDNFIAQYTIKPHPTFASLNQSSINTLRVITYILNDDIYHMPIACRMGSTDSSVDNIHAGGLVIGISDNGQMLDTAYQLGYGDRNVSFTKHPKTGVVFSEINLPSMKEVIESAYKAHCKLPRIGIVSWDYTVDDHGMPVLIEANITSQSVWFPQIVHGKGVFGDNTTSVLEKLRKGK